MTRSHAYPQVDPRASGIIDSGVVSVPRSARARRALALARLRDAAVVVAGNAYVLREDLAAATTLGLDELPATDLARPLPALDTHHSEVAARRHLAAGAPLVIVREGGRAIGAVSRRSVVVAEPSVVPMAARVRSALSPGGLDALAMIGEIALARGARAYLVGGVVRDMLRVGEVSRHDVDVVVDGDGLAVARELAARRGARVVEHPRFLTASVEGVASDGIARVDIATARTERYDERGALPRVTGGGILADLRRRDFSVNAMAIELDSGRFGLLDPLGGRADLAARRLRVLHPLSFVEDPTRIFRGARYATRLGFRLDAWSLAAQRLALRLAPYPRLSGQRIAAELERIVAEPEVGAALAWLGGAGAFRLLDPRYRFTRLTATRLRRLGEALRWASAHDLDARPLELAVATVLADQASPVAAAALRRLAVTGEVLRRLERVTSASETAVRLGTRRRPSESARVLRRLHGLELAWLRLTGDAPTRKVVDWFVERGRTATPSLRGDQLVALGVPRGPAVARALERLTDARLDGAIADAAGEQAYVQMLLGQDEGAGAGQAAHPGRGEE